jgi:hypothetical protein
MQTPAGRGVPPQAPGAPADGFGPPGSGAPGIAGLADGGYGAYTDEDFTKPGRRGTWLKRSLAITLALGVVGAALYGGYRWTQTQYYVGSKGRHIALYQGISQDLAWIGLSEVHEDHPEIELKYLPAYQRKQVEETIAVGSLGQARDKVEELGKQAGACRKRAEQAKAAAEQAEQREKAGDQQAGAQQGEAAGSAGSTPATRADGNDTTATSDSTPTPGPTLSEEETRLAKQCDSTQQ